jgi:large subunit ribosomal protein L9
VAKSLVSSTVLIPARVGPEGRLFGSVTTTEIADAIAAQTGVSIDRRQLHLDEPIRSVGTHSVPAKLHADVEFPVTNEVVAG